MDKTVKRSLAIDTREVVEGGPEAPSNSEWIESPASSRQGDVNLSVLLETQFVVEEKSKVGKEWVASALREEMDSLAVFRTEFKAARASARVREISYSDRASAKQEEITLTVRELASCWIFKS